MMLELNNYYIQELENLTDLFTNIFVIIDDIYNEIIPIGIRNRRNIKDSKLSDSEIITISIVGELLTIDSEKSFFSLLKREYKELFPRLGDKADRLLTFIFSTYNSQITQLEPVHFLTSWGVVDVSCHNWPVCGLVGAVELTIMPDVPFVPLVPSLDI